GLLVLHLGVLAFLGGLLLLGLLAGRLAPGLGRGPALDVRVELVRHLVGILVVIQVQERTPDQERQERHGQHAGAGVLGQLGLLFFVFASHVWLLLPGGRLAYRYPRFP